MKEPPNQCAYTYPGGNRCHFRAWKAGELYCMKHDIAMLLSLPPKHIRPTANLSGDRLKLAPVHALTVNKSSPRRARSRVRRPRSSILSYERKKHL